MSVRVHEDRSILPTVANKIKKPAWSIVSFAAAQTIDSYLVLNFLER